MKLILASESPRRREILRSANLDFAVVPAPVEELMTGPDPAGLPEENARRKAAWVFAKYPDCAVIGADTVIMFEGQIIGKPRDLDDAFAILSRLAGKHHQVLTGVAVLAPGMQNYFTVTSDIVFKPYDPSVIRRYLQKVHVLDKAGAYAIQEHGEMLIERIEGDRNNVVGLPLDAVLKVLNENGLIA